MIRTVTTAADALMSDPAIGEAKRMMLQVLAEHRSKLTGIRPAHAELRETYEASIERLSRIRGGNLFHPYLGSGLGRGPLVELADGSVKYDFVSGIGVHFFGHSHPDLIDAALDAALRNTIMQGNLQQNTESVRLVESLLDAASRYGAPLEHCFLTTSGAMANENALKLVFHRHAPADRLLAFEGCFCGRTLALAQITDKPKDRAGLPTTVHVDYVPFLDAEDPGPSTHKALAALERHLRSYPGRHAAMIFELILGEGGYYAGSREFFTALMDVLRQHGVAIIIDEIQTFGRTTRPFAFQHFGLDPCPDVVTVGKLSQVCATLFAGQYKPSPGLISQTFTASTSAIFAAQRILDAFDRGDLFGSEGTIARLSNRFVDRLRAIANRHPRWMRGPFGAGGMIAFTALDGTAETARKLVHALFDAGVIAFVAGEDPARVRFLPPMAVLGPADIDAVAVLVEQTLGLTASTL